jgi:hypothetical protein
MILYLMSKYTGREADSLKENQDAWLALDQKGYTVYSPICESYNIEEYRKEFNEAKYAGNAINGYIKEPDYVARDLRLIEAWLKHDYEVYTEFCRCSGWHKYQMGSMPCGAATEEGCKVDGYDSGVVAVVLPSAYHMELVEQRYENRLEDLVWDSKGAQAEYDFMKAHHILVISLATALTVPREQWEMHNL